MTTNMGDSKGKIAVIGSGLIGRSWAMLFAGGGYQVALYDILSEQVDSALSDIRRELLELEARDALRGSLSAQAQIALVEGCSDLRVALKDAIYVQECTPEEKSLKEKVFLQLDGLAGERTILASSSSAIPASVFTSSMKQRKANVIIAHPVNPPYHMPLVELVPAPWTDPDVVTRTRALMTELGQSPVTLNKEIPGFVQPRIQLALLQECLRLVLDDVISVADIDKILTDGLGLRYAFIGPFETMHLNAEGVNSYLDRYSNMVYEVASSSGPMVRLHDDPAMEKVFKELEALVPLDKLEERRRWRNEGIAELNRLKRDLDRSDTQEH